MKKLRILHNVFKQTGANKLIYGFFITVFVFALIIWIFDPTIKTFGDSLWFCYSVVTTCGFGDVIAETFISRTFSVILSIYAVLIIAIITGIVVTFYKEIMARRNEATIAAFMEKMENLPNLSHEELTELSDKIKEFRNNGKNR